MKTEKIVRIDRLTPCSPHWMTDEFGNSILMKVKVESVFVVRKKYKH